MFVAPYCVAGPFDDTRVFTSPWLSLSLFSSSSTPQEPAISFSHRLLGSSGGTRTFTPAVLSLSLHSTCFYSSHSIVLLDIRGNSNFFTSQPKCACRTFLQIQVLAQDTFHMFYTLSVFLILSTPNNCLPRTRF